MIYITGDESVRPVSMEAKAGECLIINTSVYDPDGDEVSVKWWIQKSVDCVEEPVLVVAD